MSDEREDLCSLSEGDFQGRESEWHAVLDRSVRACEELPNGFKLSLEGDGRIFAELARLAALEGHCCGWMKIDLSIGGTVPIALNITANAPGGKELIRLLIPAACQA